jgi:hypothetical protein
VRAVPLLAAVILGVAPAALADGDYAPPERAGAITDPEWSEVSGIIPVSGRKDLFWIHNDSGDRPRIAAIRASGEVAASYAVAGASAVDWEDIADGPCPGADGNHLYIADTGNNKGTRSDLSIYRLPEPEVRDAGPSEEPRTAPAERIRVRYPDGAFDCEAIAVHPGTGRIYLFTKQIRRADVYACENAPTGRKPRALVRVATLSPDLCVTAADISADGRRLLLRTYVGVEMHRLPEGAPFEAIFRQPKQRLQSPWAELQGEAICFDHEDRDYLTVGEGKAGVIHRMRRIERPAAVGEEPAGHPRDVPLRGLDTAVPEAR